MNLLSFRRAYSSRQLLRLSALVFASLAISGPARGVDAINVADATLGSKAQGTKTSIRVSNTETGVVQFLLSTLPANASIQKATLRLWVSKVIKPGSLKVFRIAEETARIDERTVTATSAPAKGTELANVTLSSEDRSQYLTIDVTSYLQALPVNDASAPAFFIEQAAAADGTTIVFDSKESPGTSHAPELEIVTGPLFAVVESDGTIARGSAGVTSTRISSGSYEVTFPKNVTGCAYMVTSALSGSAGLPPHAITGAVGRVNNPRAILVTTRDTSGTLIDRPFHVVVVGP